MYPYALTCVLKEMFAIHYTVLGGIADEGLAVVETAFGELSSASVTGGVTVVAMETGGVTVVAMETERSAAVRSAAILLLSITNTLEVRSSIA